MTPTTTISRNPDGRRVYSEPARQRCAGNSSVRFPDLSHGVLSKFGLVVVLAARWIRQTTLKGVLVVAGRCNPFEVLRPVIRLIPVLVIDLMTWRPWPKPRLSNEPVDGIITTPVPAAAEAQGKIARAIGGRAANKADTSVFGCLYPPNSAEIGHLVPTLVSDDGSPLFSFQGQGKLCRMRMHRKPNPFGATQRDGSGRRRCLIIP